MNIKGLDYNTQRDHLVMPEYGREIQKMVDYAIDRPTRQERQACAETIISLMATKAKQTLDREDQQRALWDHLYIISRKRLDIEWPYDVRDAEKIGTRPEPMDRPGLDGNIRLRHYGRLVENMVKKLAEMPAGEERDELTRTVANQMKRNLATWGHGSIDNEIIADDLARYTNGVIQIDLNSFSFETQTTKERPQMFKKRNRKNK